MHPIYKQGGQHVREACQEIAGRRFLVAAAAFTAVGHANPNGQFRCAPTETVCNTLQPQPAGRTHRAGSCPRAAADWRYCDPDQPPHDPVLSTDGDSVDTLLPGAPGASATTANQRRQAAGISSRSANAMQRSAVEHGQANSTLSNPYVEQKVTAPEALGLNRTKIPAGGF